jgi:Fur family transcriptional regulator, iron response regulator
VHGHALETNAQLLTVSKFGTNPIFVKTDVAQTLQSKGIRPSAQRIAIAEQVLFRSDHPSADQVFASVTVCFPQVSRATVYNTLNLFVEKGLLRALSLSEGNSVFDPNVEAHHHFVDEVTGTIHDIPWADLTVHNVGALKGFKVSEYQVVLRGRRSKLAKL